MNGEVQFANLIEFNVVVTRHWRRSEAEYLFFFVVYFTIIWSQIREEWRTVASPMTKSWVWDGGWCTAWECRCCTSSPLCWVLLPVPATASSPATGPTWSIPCAISTPRHLLSHHFTGSEDIFPLVNGSLTVELPLLSYSSYVLSSTSLLYEDVESFTLCSTSWTSCPS